MLYDLPIITGYVPAYGGELVAMWRASFERAVGVLDPHPIEEQLRYLEEKLLPENHIVVVLDPATRAVIGFMASTPGMIVQLYVHVDYQRRGIGAMLLAMAKERSHGTLRLFTFDANRNAQRFYERHGFRVIGRGFEKEWGLKDVEYEWRAGDADR